MSADQIKERADLMRNRAKVSAGRLFKVPEGCISLQVDSLVDDIIGAAMLEIAYAKKVAREQNGGSK